MELIQRFGANVWTKVNDKTLLDNFQYDPHNEEHVKFIDTLSKWITDKEGNIIFEEDMSQYQIGVNKNLKTAQEHSDKKLAEIEKDKKERQQKLFILHRVVLEWIRKNKHIEHEETLRQQNTLFKTLKIYLAYSNHEKDDNHFNDVWNNLKNVLADASKPTSTTRYRFVLMTIDEEREGLDVERLYSLLENKKVPEDENQKQWTKRLKDLSKQCPGSPVLILVKKKPEGQLPIKQLYCYGRSGAIWKLSLIDDGRRRVLMPPNDTDNLGPFRSMPLFY